MPLQAQKHSELFDARPWWRQLTSYHWFVFVMAALAWLFDCLDQQIFILFRDTALTSLMPEGANVKTFGGYATSIFVAGWATGGLIFGSVGDRIGRGSMRFWWVQFQRSCVYLSN